MTENTTVTILAADDNPNNLAVLEGIIAEMGYEMRAATDGKSALDSMKRLTPDLVLLDIHMPGMDGYEVCCCMKDNEELRSIPVIFISALSEGFNKVKAFECGAVDYITKPFLLEETQMRVKTHLKMNKQHKDLEMANEALRERSEKLEMFNNAMIDRETRIIDLKEEVNGLAAELGREAPYPVVWKRNRQGGVER